MAKGDAFGYTFLSNFGTFNGHISQIRLLHEHERVGIDLLNDVIHLARHVGHHRADHARLLAASTRSKTPFLQTKQARGFSTAQRAASF